MAKNQQEKEFLFPMEMVDQIYELSGGADTYKGLILCICTQNGTPQIFTKFDSVVTSLGMKKAVSEYLYQEETEIDDGK